ncbi:hypothetical protein LUZ61_011598 [Rhynchospora tenuis]|uniref:Glycosyltransferase n=1 Tax=Rhynchospora tenuis TaxID=198213 RepID=A0AAD6F0Q4_9POAL|nr:hypothetical protein LUZ61_011598 [Rhynchospora tenuis]
MASSNDTLANSNNVNLKKWRVFLIPYFARGHLIPMRDFAGLLSANHPDIEPTMVVTPTPSLKPDIETVGIGKSTDSSAIDKAAHMARPGQEQVLQKYKPDAVVADVMFPWIAAIAADLGIPCIFFSGTGAFPILIIRFLLKMGTYLGIHDHVTVSGLPGPEIRMPVLELPTFVFENNNMQKPERVIKSWNDVFGYVHNVIEQGGEGETNCLRWLDNKEQQSVIFVSFGSQCYFKSAQLHELAMGLEESGQSFLWVVRGVDQSDKWIPEGWEERIANRGLVVRGWAPQLAILVHAAIGAFMTHCGWNSILEGTAAGVPMLTWPLAFEQFINEKLLVDVVGCAARLWEGWKRSTKETESELVPSMVIAHAVSRFMEPEGEHSSVHCKARELGAVVRSAMADGGSSMSDLSRLISDLINAMENKTCQ